MSRKVTRRGKAQEQGEKINASEFWQIEEPTCAESLVLNLARAIEAASDPDYVVCSWASQQEAIDYYNTHGFEAALDRLVSITMGAK